MITLYHAPQSRSSRFVWLLEELGQPYTTRPESIRRRDGSGQQDPAYRKIHPHGKVPALDHDGVIVFESSAIALYLADAFPEARLGPRTGSPAFDHVKLHRSRGSSAYRDEPRRVAR